MKKLVSLAIASFALFAMGERTETKPGGKPIPAALFGQNIEHTRSALKAAMPDYRVYWLVSLKKGTAFATADGIVAKLMELGVDGVDCHYKPDIVTAEYVKAIRGAGYEFHVWTVDELADTVEAFRRGVQTVTTNCAKKILEEHRQIGK